MSENDLAARYDSWHGPHFDPARDPLRFAWYKSVYPHIRDHARGRLLEIGCGRGEFAVWLAQQMPALRITAVDLSQAAIGVAKERATKANADIDCRQQDAQALTFADETFDYIASCECLEHVPRPQGMASEIFRVLKPGGQFCLTTENYLNGMLIAWLHSWVTGRPFDSGSGVQPHENFFVFWRVRRYLEAAGLVVDATESCHLQWLLLPRVDPGRLCTEHFSSTWARRLAKPFGRHYSFFGHKPAAL